MCSSTAPTGDFLGVWIPRFGRPESASRLRDWMRRCTAATGNYLGVWFPGTAGGGAVRVLFSLSVIG